MTTGSFRMITLVLYIGSLPILATWFPCGRGRTLFILSSLPLYRLIIYIDGRILWCTHFLFILSWISKQFFHRISFKYSCLEYGDIVAVVFYHFRNMPGSKGTNAQIFRFLFKSDFDGFFFLIVKFQICLIKTLSVWLNI